MKAQEPSAADVVVIWSWALPLRRAVTVIPGRAAPAVFFTVPESVEKRRMTASAVVVCAGDHLDHVMRVRRRRVGVVVKRQVRLPEGSLKLREYGRPAPTSRPVNA